GAGSAPDLLRRLSRGHFFLYEGGEGTPRPQRPADGARGARRTPDAIRRGGPDLHAGVRSDLPKSSVDGKSGRTSSAPGAGWRGTPGIEESQDRRAPGETGRL